MVIDPHAEGSAAWLSLDAAANASMVRLRRGALLLAAVIAISMPAARLFFDIRTRLSTLSTEAEGLADDLSLQASTNPERWVYETNAMSSSLNTLLLRRAADAVTLVDERQRVLASAGSWVEGRVLQHEASVLDSGVAVARLKVQTSIAPSLWSAGWMALLGLALGSMTWWLVSRSALGSLAQAMQALQNARVEAEQAGRARTTFLATMSHEIRTPMNGVLGMTSLLLESPLNKVQRRYVDVIRSSGDSLLTVINDILEFSKAESGKLLLEPQTFQPEALAEDVLTLLGPAAARKQLDLLCRVHPDVPGWMLADATRLRQVLVNIVGNSVKFTDAGEVLVSVECPAPGRLRYSVRDTGIGMTAAQMTSIFEPFTQADASTTRRFGGTGLGLAISHRLVALMGGTISVDSSLGMGTTFVVEIGCNATAAPPHAAAPADVTALLGKRVLIVDDNATNLEIVQALTRGWGMQPTLFAEPEGALAQFGDGAAYDLAILDFNMPGINGAELATRLHGVRPDLPLVLLSSSDGADAAHHLFAARVNKPVQRILLLDTLLNVLGATTAPETHSDRQATLPGSLQAATDRLASLRVLVVEDNPVNAIVVRTMLERLGCLSEHVSSGSEAVEAVQRQPYDLIFMDLLMPVMNGIDASLRIRSLPLEKQPYIVAFTANVMAEDRAACAEAQMNAFLAKPVRLIDLEMCLSAFTRSMAA